LVEAKREYVMSKQLLWNFSLASSFVQRWLHIKTCR